jgi:hypothetical protein
MSEDRPRTRVGLRHWIRRRHKVGDPSGKQTFVAILDGEGSSAGGSGRADIHGGPRDRAGDVSKQADVTVRDPEAAPARRSPIERAVLVPVGAALLALEELIGVASTLVDAEKAGRELLHFEERGMRARAHVEGLVHHHRGRLADRLELQIEQTRGKVNDLASKGSGIASKIRP